MLSSSFVNKVLERIEKLDVQSLKDFIYTLSEHRIFYETIFESMIEGLTVLNDTHQILYINKPAKIMLNIVEANILEKNFFDVIKEKKSKNFFQDLITKNQKLQGEELTLRYPVTKTLQVRMYPLVKDGKISGNVLMLLDITSAKNERMKLRRAESLAALTTLAAGVAHEIKNPLGALDIHVQLLDRLTDELNHETRQEFKKHLSVVEEEIDRMNNIVQDFLFTVRPIHIEPKEENIFELFESIINLMKYDFEIKGIQLRLEGDHTIPKSKVDGRYLKHAFINILKNSLEGTDKGDEVTIYVNRDEENLVIIISDSGKGISQENIAKIFDPYFTTKEFGTGLGLTIVYKIIKEHGGNIQLDSVEGEGTTFTFSIPCYEEQKRLLGYD